MAERTVNLSKSDGGLGAKHCTKAGFAQALVRPLRRFEVAGVVLKLGPHEQVPSSSERGVVALDLLMKMVDDLGRALVGAQVLIDRREVACGDGVRRPVANLSSAAHRFEAVLERVAVLVSTLVDGGEVHQAVRPRQ